MPQHDDVLELLGYPAAQNWHCLTKVFVIIYLFVCLFTFFFLPVFDEKRLVSFYLCTFLATEVLDTYCNCEKQSKRFFTSIVLEKA